MAESLLMKCACATEEEHAMRVGDIDGIDGVYRITARRDPSGFVVDFSGTLIIEPGEKTLFFKIDSLLDIAGSSSKTKDRFPLFGGELAEFYPEAGWGAFFFTDRRIVFLRKPEWGQLWEVYKDAENVGHIFRRALHIHEQGAMEYLEVRYEDIADYEEGRYTVTATIRGTTHSEYKLRFDKEDFERVKPILERRLVTGRRRPLKRHSGPFALLILELALLAGIILKDDMWRWMLLLGFSVMPLLILYGHAFRPRLGTVKKNKWGQHRLAFLGAIIAVAVGVVFVTMGIIATALGGGFEVLLVTAFMSALMFGLTFLARREWRYHSINHRFVLYEYQCPTCGALVSRRDIGCAHCGAVIWWLHLRKFRIKYHGRRPVDDAWERATPQFERQDPKKLEEVC